ncbi:large ribosomal subunit protein bL36m [Tenrec ecaudatus]|uniref:large ribosomal subunit protein bL36m n=1 Tax=Tenrec ecaudatus TaxID=94439 RepID=UPI003F5A57E1
MAAYLIRTVAVSLVHPFLHLSRCTVRSQGLSTFLQGSFFRTAFPMGSSPLPTSPGLQSLLPSSLTPCLQPALGFKTKGVIKKRCKDCYRVKRRGRWFIYCKTHPRHKQRQM